MNSPLTPTFSGDPVTNGFEQLYTRLRQKEGRLYTDEEVAGLPQINNKHPHFKEWTIRKKSCRALLSYIMQRQNILNILEVGCGNGWLSAKLSTVAEVTGLDINTTELEQAKRVFGHIANLTFSEGSLENDWTRDEKFDLVVFASSIQYFASLKQTIRHTFEHLTLMGEIHILDSPFYQQHEMEAAKQRTTAYYNALGFAEMADHYHHHTMTDLEPFQFKILNHPHSWKNKLSIRKNPFYWISIKNSYR